MLVLVNISPEEEPHLPQLAYFLRRAGLEAMSTKKSLDLGSLISLAKRANCAAILLCNEETLRHCVPGNKPTLDNWRGSRLNFSVPTIVINKLAQINKVPHAKWLLEKDLEKLQHLKKRPMPFSYTKMLNPDDFPDIIQDLSESIAIYTDVETKTFDPVPTIYEGVEEVGKTVITCSAWTGIFENGQLRTYMLPLIDYDGDHWRDDPAYFKALLTLKRINALPVPKAMHNGMYDSTHLLVYNAPPLEYTLDTMAFAHAEFAELPKDLAFVASYRLYDYMNWKDDAEIASKSRDQEKYWSYNARDTWMGARILISQLREMPAYAFKNYKTKFKLVYPALYGNFEGFKIDQAARLKVREKAVTDLEKSRASIRVQMSDPNFNPGSWQQVEKAIYDMFGAKKPKIGKSKSGTDEKNLLAVMEQHPLLARVIPNILTYRENQKAIGTYYDYIQCIGRLLWALNPFGAETERMACNASSFWCGTQVQNIPKYAKEMLVADDGYELFEADNKQSEGRTTAYCSQEEALIAALEDAERDFYKTLGTLFFSIPYEEVTDFFRNSVLKRIVHGTNYMMKERTFIENIGVRVLLETAPKLGLKIVEIPEKGSTNEYTLRGFAGLLLEAYHGPFPRVRKWYDEIKYEVSSTGFLVSPLGHTRRCFGDIERDHAMLRSLVAHQPQNLSVEILNKGFNRLYTGYVLKDNGNIRLKAQIHDSILGQVRIGMRDHYAPIILECMNNPVQVHGRTLRIPVDIKFGTNWRAMKEWKPSKEGV